MSDFYFDDVEFGLCVMGGVGICLSCGIVCEGVHADLVEGHCATCGQPGVTGLRAAFVQGRLSIGSEGEGRPPTSRVGGKVENDTGWRDHEEPS